MSGSGPRIRVDAPTEGRNPRTRDIDRRSSLEVLELLNAEDARVAAAVHAALPALAAAVDAAVERWEAGGRLHYFGAGTSGRIGMLDAAELPPTFSVDPDRAVAHHAGGAGAVKRAVEASEDSVDLGRAAAVDVRAEDIAVGIAASGRTPYVVGALEASRKAGAFTVAVSSSPHAPIAEVADIHVFADTGPEAIAGSTRLKAGTAQKMILNSLSTALMIRLGKTYSNLMVEVAGTNAKLRGRTVAIVEEASGASEADSVRALEAADGDLRTALVMLLAGVDAGSASDALQRTGGRARAAVEALTSAPTTEVSRE